MVEHVENVEKVENGETLAPHQMTIEQVGILNNFFFAFLKDTILEIPNVFLF